MLNNFNHRIGEYADSAVGEFDFTGPRDQWLIDRTRQWCSLHTRGEWSFRIDMTRGTIMFMFMEQHDADAFRNITRQTETLITCR